jgi:hypothetical protein
MNRKLAPALEATLTRTKIERRIYEIRNQRVILDLDLAELYGVEVKRLNEQVRRNWDRFPTDFAFQLTDQEVANLKSQIATSSLQTLPYQVETQNLEGIFRRSFSPVRSVA